MTYASRRPRWQVAVALTIVASFFIAPIVGLILTAL